MSASTTEVVIEAAHFDPVTIAHTARKHKLPSEASKRFERGVDPTLGPVAAQRVAELLVRYGGGTIASTATILGLADATRSRSRSMPRCRAAIAGFEIDQADSRQRADSWSAAR